MSDETLYIAIKQYEQYGEITPCSECEHFRSFGNGYGECCHSPSRTAVMKTTDFCSYAKKKVPLPEFDDHTVSGLLDD